MYLPFDPAISLGFYPKEIKHVSTERLSMNIHNSFIYNCQNPETTQMFINSNVSGKTIVIYLHNGVLFSNTKEWTIDIHSNMDESLKKMMLNE